jgi:hypothetical protein
LQGLLVKTGLAAVVATAAPALLAGCGDTPEPAALPALLPPPAEARSCGESGYLRTNFYGELSGPIDWSGGDFDCEGMPRPEGEGARLRFAGPAGDLAIAIIIAMPGLERAATGRELGSNVTVIEEGGGRFFSTAGLDNCWTDVHEQRPADAGTQAFFVAGTLYCIAPLAEVNGDSSITLRELEFGGYLDWGSK